MMRSKGSRLREFLGRLDYGGTFDLLQGKSLTVLCYHRIGAPDNRFHGFRPNFSASPRQFTLQMRFLRKFFSPVSLQDVLNWFETGRPLPRRAVLVTFDDGYRDNGDVAWPIMRSLQIPGVIFLATDHIGTNKPFLWDYAAYCFEVTKQKRAVLPLLGEMDLETSSCRYRAASAWVEASKRLPAGNRRLLLDALAVTLRVSPPPQAFADLQLDWPTVRRLKEEGLEFGGHTHTHPILTQLALPEARHEIITSQQVLCAQLGMPARAFAYPNGSAADFFAGHEDAIREAGFSIGFSLEHGPAKLDEIRQRPTAIRRLYVGRRDTIPRLFLKCLGAARVASGSGRGRQFISAARESSKQSESKAC
ncbi:polysaccharide deacetylase family protein [Microvirga sp. BSC39]|uniref:polysaccharide deacetylase family protein n=1 Tax=Microvirga sp. BSC39 TaxID=1549810 RepID=UPI0004E8637F|nr:polysaccharide deacetylase family protein [Microvirga sp. BSC39]KFG68482.1 hypothetical protein JH26_16725 [Microvirga sp. BSC39]